jgi:hypothetical protein
MGVTRQGAQKQLNLLLDRQDGVEDGEGGDTAARLDVGDCLSAAVGLFGNLGLRQAERFALAAEQLAQLAQADCALKSGRRLIDRFHVHILEHFWRVMGLMSAFVNIYT